ATAARGRAGTRVRGAEANRGQDPGRVASAAAMAQIEPLRALHYNLEKTGGLQNVVAPPYDVIDTEQRAELERRSPYNVVSIDLPQGDHPYETAKQTLDAWRAEDVV